MEGFQAQLEDFVLVILVQKAIVGGNIALIEDGDEIQIDAEKGTINLNVDNEILEKRKSLQLTSLMNLDLDFMEIFSNCWFCKIWCCYSSRSKERKKIYSDI